MARSTYLFTYCLPRSSCICRAFYLYYIFLSLPFHSRTHFEVRNDKQTLQKALAKALRDHSTILWQYRLSINWQGSIGTTTGMHTTAVSCRCDPHGLDCCSASISAAT